MPPTSAAPAKSQAKAGSRLSARAQAGRASSGQAPAFCMPSTSRPSAAPARVPATSSHCERRAKKRPRIDFGMRSLIQATHMLALTAWVTALSSSRTRKSASAAVGARNRAPSPKPNTRRRLLAAQATTVPRRERRLRVSRLPSGWKSSANWPMAASRPSCSGLAPSSSANFVVKTLPGWAIVKCTCASAPSTVEMRVARRTSSSSTASGRSCSFTMRAPQLRPRERSPAWAKLSSRCMRPAGRQTLHGACTGELVRGGNARAWRPRRGGSSACRGRRRRPAARVAAGGRSRSAGWTKSVRHLRRPSSGVPGASSSAIPPPAACCLPAPGPLRPCPPGSGHRAAGR